MVSLEKLNSNTMELFKKLHNKSIEFNTYNKNFFKYYDKQGLINKYIYRKFVRIIKYNDRKIGFIWYEAPIDITVRVWGLYIQEEYIDKVNNTTLDYFNHSILNYESVTNAANVNLLKRLGFKKVKSTLLMKCYIKDYNLNSLEQDKKIYYKNFDVGYDEKLRCNIQNEIFYDNSRTPLTIEDIYNDISQDYYINKYAIFMMRENTCIGYGQIVNNNDVFTLVNFGISKKHRGRGYSKYLLNYIIGVAKVDGIKDLYLRVDIENTKALKLYNWAGFTEIEEVYKWERA